MTIYVNTVVGHDNNDGCRSRPVRSIAAAVRIANDRRSGSRIVVAGPMSALRHRR
jgi:hypothetical protein